MKIMRRILAVVLCLIMVLALAGCKSKAAKAAEALIDAIGTVSAESETAVKAAEEAFKALEEKERAQVENAQKLTDARNTLDVALTEKLIDAIGEVTTESENLIAQAEAAFSALTDEQKSAVSNAGVLTEAREKLEAALEAARLEALRQQLVGVWMHKVEMGPTITSVIEASLAQNYGGFGLKFSDYLDSYVMGMKLSLNDDGTYLLEADTDVMQEENEKLGKAIVEYLSACGLASMGEYCVENGLAETAPTTWDEVDEVLSLSEEVFFVRIYGKSKENLASYYSGIMADSLTSEESKENGSWQVEEGKLLLDDTGGNEFTDDRAINYTLEGGVMTWTDGTMPLADPMEYPAVFDKIG